MGCLVSCFLSAVVFLSPVCPLFLGCLLLFRSCLLFLPPPVVWSALSDFGLSDTLPGHSGLPRLDLFLFLSVCLRAVDSVAELLIV